MNQEATNPIGTGAAPAADTAAVQAATTSAEQPAAAKAPTVEELTAQLGEVLGTAKPQEKQEGTPDTKAPAAAQPTAEAAKTFTQAEVDALKVEWEKVQKSGVQPKEEPAKEPDLQAELNALKAEVAKGKLKEDAVAQLGKAELPVELADLLHYDSKERLDKSLEQLTGVFNKALESAMKQKLSGKTPAGLGDTTSQEAAIAHRIATNIRG